MPRPAPEARALADVWRLVLPESVRTGAHGERLGRGTGSSLEFEDRREYAAGDDVRHLDWRAMARTDRALVRLYRAEVAPRVEVLLDASRSMATEPAKAQLAVDLAALFAGAARGAGLRAALVRLGDAPEPLDPDALAADGVDCDARVPLDEALGAARDLLRPGAVRLLVSDFLAPVEVPGVVRALAAGAGRLVLVQVLGPFDAEPRAGEALRLVDSETAESLDLVLDAPTVARYRERLARLEAELAREARRAGGAYARCVAGPPLAEVCRGELLAARVIEPA